MTPRALRWLYLFVGCLCTGLGVLGAFLPVLPTTPFLLLALWAFSNSSPRLHAWLYHHPRYGKSLQAWSENGAISLRVKTIAVAAMAFSVVVLYLVTENAMIVSIHLGILLLVALYILTRPTL
mgnify:FL=1